MGLTITTVTVYFIHPSGTLKLSFDKKKKKKKKKNEGHISIILSHETRTYTLLDIRPLYLNLHTLIANPKLPGIMLSLSNRNVKTNKLNKNH